MSIKNVTKISVKATKNSLVRMSIVATVAFIRDNFMHKVMNTMIFTIPTMAMMPTGHIYHKMIFSI